MAFLSPARQCGCRATLQQTGELQENVLLLSMTPLAETLPYLPPDTKGFGL